MRVLVSEKLSEHKYKTPEGYLICTDAILARTGKQTYTRDELFGDGDSTEVNVDRPYNEEMNEKTIASFENKPITFDHPEEDVNIGNYKSYAVGYVRDVRQGKVDGKDVILGNLVITDKDAIDAIENGDHTDLSCGYDCDIKDDGNGNYAQNNIRGNHVALCREGRAGMARIVDSRVSYKDLDAAMKNLYSYGYKFDVDSVGRGRLKITPIEGQDFDKLVKAFRANAYQLIMSEGEQCFYIKDSKMNDSLTTAEKELCNYMLKNALDDDDTSEDLLKKMKAYYTEYRNLAYDKPKEVLRYFKSYLYDSKVEDSKIYMQTQEFNKSFGKDEEYYIILRYGVRIFRYYGRVVIIGSRQALEQLYKDYHLRDYNVTIDDSKMEDAADYSWFKGYINGDLQSFNINSLISSVKSRKQPLHANLTGKSGNVYSVFIDGSLESNVDKGSNMWIDIVVEYPDRQQKRLISKDFNSWNECQNIFNDFKNKVRDSKVNDSGYTYKGYDLIDFGNVIAVQKDGRTLVKCPTEKEAEEWVDEHVSTFADSRKGMSASDAIKLINVIDKCKKVKDADADKWVIKNTGLAYEIWNQGKMVKKLPTKKLAIEWIHSRFPNDEITEA